MRPHHSHDESAGQQTFMTIQTQANRRRNSAHNVNRTPNRYGRFYAVAGAAGLSTSEYFKSHRNRSINSYFGWNIKSLTELSDAQLSQLCDAIEGGAFLKGGTWRIARDEPASAQLSLAASF
jgi:NADP-dependent 3-hydroxy acid dehydrogenase YdfG